MKKKLIVLSGIVLGLAPVVALADVTTTGTGLKVCSTTSGDISAVLCTISGILNAVVPVLVALGVVYFVWGVVSYVIASDEEAKKSGRDRIIYGIIGLAVIVGVWGLVRILTRTFDIQNAGTITLPTIR